ncbi:hypothetical protein G7Z17_g4299 [Cylindrodendrum hubeiense]|uniref:Uncharacterized protein n=1 Tax=Cylindrodendrum hubeiense TaxID=595255 RepID=A0A9P5H948_9HYPO|nr:hypothetical protein G7Z17_g4299 [Cylindrodendrum hubeiense]
MHIHPQQREEALDGASAARNLVSLLTPLLTDDTGYSSGTSSPVQMSTRDCRGILSAIQALVPTLIPDSPIFAAFHDGQVHDPLGGGSYAFQDDLVGPVLQALLNDEALSNDDKRRAGNRSDETSTQNCPTTNHELNTQRPIPLPNRPIVIHAGVQPNNSPHVGTIVVFCYAFSLARGIRDRMQAAAVNVDDEPPFVSVEITFVDTAPVKGEGTEIGGIEYQRSYRDVPGALDTYMADYEEVLYLLSTWSGIRVTTAFQYNLFSSPIIPSILRYFVAHHDLLGRQLSPKHGKLALRAACPIPGCALAEKHGQLNIYNDTNHAQNKTASPAANDPTITFHCPHHGPHTISVSNPADVARLEANAPARSLIRSMSHLLDTKAHHVRITGADYAGMYQEMFLYRPLAAWSAATGLAAGRTPHILYAPLIVDWSGAKLSKTLYVREGGYNAMKLFGTDGLGSFAQLKSRFGSNGSEGLRRIWEEVQGWLGDPKKLFRPFSLEYLQRVIIEEKKWES